MFGSIRQIFIRWGQLCLIRKGLKYNLLNLGCAGNAVPLVPGDNSHYVEGESRYIWMPDGEGNPVLVDLEEPVDEAYLNSRNGANNQYWLFTRYLKKELNIDQIKYSKHQS